MREEFYRDVLKVMILVGIAAFLMGLWLGILI